jgi:carbamoylphosphate synthase large subunit
MPRVGKNLKIPYIVKRKVAHMGMDCYVIDTPEKEKEHLHEINHPDFFCQEIVPGKKEYATHLIFRDGKMVCALNVVYIFSTPFYVKGVDKFIGNKIGKCPHLDLFTDILNAINFEGICCFNYKEIDGKPYVFEINPRFGGSLSMFFFAFLRRL